MEIKKEITKIRKLDVKRKKYSEQIDGFYQRTSPAGGFNLSPFNDVSELLYNIAEKQAKIWNKIRSVIILKNSFKTLWNLAVEKGLDVKIYGNERILKFGYDELIALIPVSQRKQFGIRA